MQPLPGCHSVQAGLQLWDNPRKPILAACFSKSSCAEPFLLSPNPCGPMKSLTAVSSKAQGRSINGCPVASQVNLPEMKAGRLVGASSRQAVCARFGETASDCPGDFPQEDDGAGAPRPRPIRPAPLPAKARCGRRKCSRTGECRPARAGGGGFGPHRRGRSGRGRRS